MTNSNQSESTGTSTVITNFFKGIFSNNQGVLRNVFATLTVIALEALISNKDLEFFKCPAKHNFSYGCMFIFVPALVVFLAMFLLSNRFKTDPRGCCYPLYPDEKNTKCRCVKGTNWKCNMEMLQLFLYSLVAACLWVFWALFQKKYYTCAVFGSEDQLKNITGKNRTMLVELYQKAQTESEIYAFVLIALTMGIPVLFQSAYRCYKRRSSSIPVADEYRRLEDQAVEDKMIEKIRDYSTTNAESIVKRLFTKFSDNIKPGEPSIADVIGMMRKVHAYLSKMEGYNEAMNSLGDIPELKAFAEKFKKIAEEVEEKEATSANEDQWPDLKSEDIEKLLRFIITEYPRMVGDHRAPNNKDDEAMNSQGDIHELKVFAAKFKKIAEELEEKEGTSANEDQWPDLKSEDIEKLLRSLKKANPRS